MNLIIIGPQASGKGTQADILAKELGIAHISIGEVFRKEVKSGTALGKQLKEYMERGDLVPPEINDHVVKTVLEQHPGGVILDGYPRTQHQAVFLDTLISIDAVIVLRVPDAVCIERISGRRVCDNGHDYHLVYKKPREEGLCDHDGLPLRMRSDDKPEAIAHRLEIFHKQTEPIIQHYAGRIIEIDGTGSIEEVHNAVATQLATSIKTMDE